ncbi:MAG: hypothetical protein IE891_06650, partial [Flavobacteriaceae bacterium]|nr:hypothetical protein [Flavobacteriaceae bacterium]
MNSQSNSHTHCQAAQANAQTKAWQRVCLSHPDKIELKKSSLLSENKKYTTAQPDTDRQKSERSKTHINQADSDFQTQWTRTPAANSGFASCGVTVVNSSVVFQFNFSAGLTVLCPEIPHERQAAKYYVAYKKSQHSVKHIWFLPTLKPNAEKPKE